MKRISMSQEGRLKDAVRRRKLSRAGRMGVMMLATSIAAMWGYVLLYSS